MNDEVKLILTKLKIVSKEKENGAYICDKEHSKLLLSYIEQLEKRNKQLYEGFMATQEELTDYATKNEQLETKVKNLQNQVNIIKDNNEELKRRLKLVQRKRDTHKAIRYRLQNNRDDAIEMLETYKRMLSLYSQPVNTFDLQDVIDTLKGGSDE